MLAAQAAENTAAQAGETVADPLCAGPPTEAAGALKYHSRRSVHE
jgi:hypothetical protein